MSHLLATILLFSAITSAGCGKACPDIAYVSSVRLTLHLPAQQDIVMPEMVRVCQDEACATATLPAVMDAATIANFTFERDAATPFLPGNTVTLTAGGVRRLDINWSLAKGTFNPKSAGNLYDVEVKDATGAATGKLFETIDYEHHVDDDCGIDFWTGEASD